jgi:hypothetical protein
MCRRGDSADLHTRDVGRIEPARGPVVTRSRASRKRLRGHAPPAHVLPTLKRSGHPDLRDPHSREPSAPSTSPRPALRLPRVSGQLRPLPSLARIARKASPTAPPPSSTRPVLATCADAASTRAAAAAPAVALLLSDSWGHANATLGVAPSSPRRSPACVPTERQSDRRGHARFPRRVGLSLCDGEMLELVNSALLGVTRRGGRA